MALVEAPPVDAAEISVREISRLTVMASRRTRAALERAIPSGWFVETREPIMTPDSEPEPDVAIIRGASDDYGERHPSPSEVALVVEVADSTLQRGRTPKRVLYGRAGIPYFWVENLIERCVEVYSAPQGDDYTQWASCGEAEEVPVILAGQEIARIPVASLLP